MNESKNSKYYLGLDIGTDSIGYAVTDEQYNLLKFHGEPAWGSAIFEPASTNSERRAFRTARRRLDRKQQRVLLLQELFAKEIANIDEKFFWRIKRSYLLRDEAGEPFTLFNDDGFTDKEYYSKYPTIHHLIVELMKDDSPHDVRLVYLACAWLVSHRGHFLSNISKENLSEIRDFSRVYDDFINYFIENGYREPWGTVNLEYLADILKRKAGITWKNKELTALVLNGSKPSKEGTDDFPFSLEGIIKLLAGGTYKLSDLFNNAAYSDAGSVSLGLDDDKMGTVMASIGEDYALIDALRRIYDWTMLIDVLGDNETVSEAKVNVYDQHKKDLSLLKRIIIKYRKEKYDEVFRALDKDNYTAYVNHTDQKDTQKLKKKNKEDFSKYILSVLKGIEPEEADKAEFENMLSRLELRRFLPKQKETDNRVIPHQLYWYELTSLLKKAEKYLPFLTEKDDKGFTVSNKIESVFLFRVPYFVGPLNTHSDKSWIVRKPGRILPWNFNEMVDLDASEDNFIKRMTNTCTYLSGETVLPKDSLCYHRFMVLNEINNIRINGLKISVELKQKIYNELFSKNKKVTRKKLNDFLICNGFIIKGEEDSVTGIDVDIKSDLKPQIAFRQLMANGQLSENDVEKIIERSAYAEDKMRLSKWIKNNFPNIDEADRKYICNIKIRDFGRLSRKFLCDFEGVDKSTGEIYTILGALWNTQNNLMELLSNRFSFIDNIQRFNEEYYGEHKNSLEDRLDDMYISNAVKRPIYRTLDIVKDVTKAFGIPEKIFIEMTRGGSPDQKGQRTKTRKQQILELYDKCKSEDVKLLKHQLDAMGDTADNRLQSDKLFLYYIQLGRSMYSWKEIRLEELGTKEYDIDHIYPQAYIKDDSIINNKVLVLSSENGAKSDRYPISVEIREKMKPYWSFLKDSGLISDEKYNRLVRNTAFSEDEKLGFINRQLTETSQSTKAMATLLKERFPETEIVYCKARLTSEFRNEYDLFKSRLYNDLHHAVDAYLNIVTGNVYNMKFSKRWFNVDSEYSIKTKTIFNHRQICGGTEVWSGKNMLDKVLATAVKNTAHFTKYAYFKKGGLFDQMPVKAAEGLTPLKKGRDTSKYGGYNKAGAMFFIPVKYRAGKKSEILIMSVEMLEGEKFLKDEVFAKEYTFKRLKHILGKNVDAISFPLGMRPWKVNTVLSLDGFKVCISGISSGGKGLIAQSIMQFSSDKYWKYYLKKLESFNEKVKKNPKYIYSLEFDKISAVDNLKLYDLYIEKLQKSIYSKRVNAQAPLDTLVKGRELFGKLEITQQAEFLLNAHMLFGRLSGGTDLSLVGGVKKAGSTVNLSATISNWKKIYKSARVIDVATSGLWEKKSCNLLELV